MYDIRLLDMTFIERSVDKLKAMTGVSLVDNYLSKNGKKFGVIKDDTVYFVDYNGNMKKVSNKVLQDTDKFLMVATRSYWIASGKKFDEGIFSVLKEIDKIK